MAKQEAPSGRRHAALLKHALTFPEAAEGVACKGTAIECPTVLARNKTFLFLGRKELRLKLAASAAEAENLGIKVGAGGWATIPVVQEPQLAVLKRWVKESYRLVVPKSLAAELDAS
jgi:hypothetical protein